MAYCTITEVRGLNPKRTYNTSSTPTATQVEEFIDRIADEIDVVLKGRGLTTPITTPTEFVSFLKQMNAYGAAALAEQAMFPEAMGTPGGSPRGATLWAQYQQALKYIRAGQLPTGANGVGLPFSFFEQHEDDDAAPQADKPWARPKFGKNKEF